MRKVFIFGLSLTLVLSFSAVSMGKDSIAERLQLENTTQKEVYWSHRGHGTSSKIPVEDRANHSCTTCHGDNPPTRGVLISQKTGKPLDISTIVQDGVKNKMHVEFCWECHNVKKVNVGKKCATCHTGPKT